MNRISATPSSSRSTTGLKPQPIKERTGAKKLRVSQLETEIASALDRWDQLDTLSSAQRIDAALLEIKERYSVIEEQERLILNGYRQNSFMRK